MSAHSAHTVSNTGWPVVAMLVVLAAGYVLVSASDRRRWSRWRTVAWLAGCAVLAVAVSPPLSTSDGVRAHILQHLLLGMLAPLGLASGAPVTLLLRVSPQRYGADWREPYDGDRYTC
jgi:putative membrane protein